MWMSSQGVMSSEQTNKRSYVSKAYNTMRCTTNVLEINFWSQRNITLSSVQTLSCRIHWSIT